MVVHQTSSFKRVLTLDLLKECVAGEYAAIRRIMRLEPQGEKVFPPTYEAGEYAVEPRQVEINGQIQTVDTVLLDSVQSQANRMEAALLEAYESGRISMPMLAVSFSGCGPDPLFGEIGRITALDAPHRMCDAIFRDSVWPDGRPFREAGLGERLNAAKSCNATPVFELCPTALLFGFWDSGGPRGGLGAKVQRAIVSEIVGYQVAQGKRTCSRIDPLQIENNVDIFQKRGGGWTLNEDQAERERNSRPVKLKTSEINHGNITPSLRHKDKESNGQVLNHGGVTIAYAIQHTVMSLAALRRLRFPLDGRVDPIIDEAARTVLAALGLAALCLLDEQGYDLRSRCLLDGIPGSFEFVGRGELKPFDLDAKNAVSLLHEAVQEAMVVGLRWPEEPVILRPSQDLCRLVVESRKRSMAAALSA